MKVLGFSVKFLFSFRLFGYKLIINVSLCIYFCRSRRIPGFQFLFDGRRCGPII